IYGDEPFKRLSEEELRFQCDCSRERFLNALASLPASDVKEMKDEDHGAEITCQFCQTHYHFDENDLEELIRDKS
ncbi:MAG: Hsp33 family molecular chaperone HslO, partial [Streptococcus sanguinis]|nr:Hsp33 family molecular chaperone HslO [Streptococcus sanguinis]